MRSDAMILVFWMLSFKPAYLLSSFTFIKKFFSSSLLSAIIVVSSAYLRLLIFLLASWFQFMSHLAKNFAWCTLHMSWINRMTKLGKGPWCTPFPILNQSVVPCPVLTFFLSFIPVSLCGNLNILWHCLSLGLEWNHLFQPCAHCWVFQICWHIEHSTFTESSFGILNCWAGIPSPLALFLIMLPKAHLISHSRMSDSTWVTTPLWLSGSLRSFLYSFSVYSCHLFLIFSASVRSMPFLSFIMLISAWNAPLPCSIFWRDF